MLIFIDKKNHRVGYELRFVDEHEKINIGCLVILIYLV
jgi:hypothetical protein